MSDVVTQGRFVDDGYYAEVDLGVGDVRVPDCNCGMYSEVRAVGTGSTQAEANAVLVMLLQALVAKVDEAIKELS